MTKTEPTELDMKLATLLIGVDTLFGGDAMHESGAYHIIADTWFSGTPPPQIYNDSFAHAARDFSQGKEGAPNVLEDADAVNDFVNRLGLRTLPDEIQEFPTNLGKDDIENLYHLTDALSVMLDTVLAQINRGKLPSFELRYNSATAYIQQYHRVANIEVVNPSEAREKLRDALADVGYEVTSSRTLRETVLAWEKAQKHLAPEKIAVMAKRINAELLEAMRSRIFSHLNFGADDHEPDLSDVAFSGHRFKTISGVSFTGSNIYQGGEEGGVPALRGLFEYNTDHPITEIKLYYLCSHEVIGHYINSAVQDILWRSGKLGFSATIATMCTPEVVFQEGWAQNIFELIYGSREAAAEVHGKHLLVALAHSDLEDFGKHNSSVLYQRDGTGLDEVQRHLADDCVQLDPIVKKLSGAWAQHPIIGPMYGPAYLHGREIVNAAIREHGNLPIAEIGYHLKGMVDIGTFQAKVSDYKNSLLRYSNVLH